MYTYLATQYYIPSHSILVTADVVGLYPSIPHESRLNATNETLENRERKSEFNGVNFLYYDFNKISLNRGGSYIDSPKWLKDKKSTINPKNNDDKCFQYAVTLALNIDRIKKDPQN